MWATEMMNKEIGEYIEELSKDRSGGRVKGVTRMVVIETRE